MDMGKHPPVFYFLFFLDVQGRVKSFGEERSFGVETLRAPLGGRSGNKFIIATAIFEIFSKKFSMTSEKASSQHYFYFEK